MQVSGPHPLAPLRLVHPPGVTRASAPPDPATSAAATYRFESIYAQALPRVPMTEAHQRLERIRPMPIGSNTERIGALQLQKIARLNQAISDTLTIRVVHGSHGG